MTSKDKLDLDHIILEHNKEIHQKLKEQKFQNDHFFTAQELISLIGKGIVGDISENRIQPSSFEPVISDDVYRIPDIFLPSENKSIYRTLLELPKSQRQSINISGGEVLKRGFCYAIKLEDKLNPKYFKTIRSSPKSSLGRLFLKTRCAFDYSPFFDLAYSNNYRSEKLIDYWLIAQPRKIDVIIKPGMTLNQLRFSNGLGLPLNPDEIKEEFDKNPLLKILNDDNKLIPAYLKFINESMRINVDTIGKNTDGVIAFMAKDNPNPIDLSESKKYDVEEYFTPILRNEKHTLKIEPNEQYLAVTKEWLSTPDNLAFELKVNSPNIFRGDMHDAGFIDNGFNGFLVFEITSSESTPIILEDNSPIGELLVFKTNNTDKPYGENIGSHYNEQKGPKISKFFKDIDYSSLARKYESMNEEVLVQDARLFQNLINNQNGFTIINERILDDLEHAVLNGFFSKRYDCEFDEKILQLIPYIVIFDKTKNVFCYSRSNDVNKYREKRLHDKLSIGVGGHIIKEDSPFYLQNGLIRKLKKEVDIVGNITYPKIIGLLYSPIESVDRVHFGIIYKSIAEGEIKPKNAMSSGRFISIEEMENIAKNNSKCETWSKILGEQIQKIYEL